MNYRELIVEIAVGLLIILVSIGPFLPGAISLAELAKNLYFINAIAAIFGFMFIPVWLMILILVPKERKPLHRLSIFVLPKSFIVAAVVSLVCTFYLHEPLRNYSRTVAMKNAQPLIASIMRYQNEHREYPQSLEDLVPQYLQQLPAPGILGISDYQYDCNRSKFTLLFTQVFSGFSVEVVVYDSQNAHDFRNKFSPRYNAGFPNWKYIEYD